MDEKYPEVNKEELVHRGTKVGLSLVPYLGGAITELFNLVIEPPLEKRRTEWLNALASAVDELKQNVEGFSVETLAENPLFITTILHTTQTAIRTHQEEKLRMLRNIVQNSAMGNTPEESTHMILLHYVDILTPWHLNILTFLDDPKRWLQAHQKAVPKWSSSSISSAIELAFPEMVGKGKFYQALVTDLYNYHLLNTEGRMVNAMMTGEGALSPRTTGLAKDLIKLITTPKF